MIGMLVAVVFIVIDLILKKMMSSVRLPVMAVAVGMYLPITLSTPIFIGGLIAFLLRQASSDKQQQGTLFASGLIAGEALIGILLAIPFAIVQDTAYFYIVEDPRQDWITLLGVTVIGYVCYMLYRTGLENEKPNRP